MNGKRFGNGKLPAWSAKDSVGPWFTEAFPYAVPFGVVATYERANKQSEVNWHIAVFGDEAADHRDAGRVLGGCIDNDQFWRVFALPGTKSKRLGVHVRHAAGPHGLSEIEAYSAATK